MSEFANSATLLPVSTTTSAKDASQTLPTVDALVRVVVGQVFSEIVGDVLLDVTSLRKACSLIRRVRAVCMLVRCRGLRLRACSHASLCAFSKTAQLEKVLSSNAPEARELAGLFESFTTVLSALSNDPNDAAYVTKICVVNFE
jgi:hypothetical protein